MGYPATAAVMVMMMMMAQAHGQEIVPLEGFAAELGDGWAFHNGSEFPGATGSLERAEEAGRDGAGGRLSFDFTGGGAYVQATLKLPEQPALEAVELWVRKPVSNRMTARATDEQGQTFQKSFSFRTRGWQKLRVLLDGWTFSWGGPADGVFHGRAVSFGLLVEKVGGEEAGAVDLDELVGIPQKGEGRGGVHEPSYVVTRFGPEDGWGFAVDGPAGASGREGNVLRYDFSAGATSVRLGNEESLLGRPKELSLKLRSDGSGHEVSLSIYSHFQHFHKVLGSLEEEGEVALTVPLGNMSEWEHSGGPDDGVARMPLRVGTLRITRREGGAERGEVTLKELAVRTECPADAVVFPLTRATRGEAGEAGFELTARSLAMEELAASVTVRLRDFAGRVLDEREESLTLPPAGVPAKLHVPAPEGERAFTEAQFTVTAPGQKSQTTSAVHVLPWSDPGTAELQPESPWGMGLYLYRYPGDGGDMDQAAAMAQAAGIKWSREEFLWHRIEPKEGEFDWSFYDKVVETAQRHGISIYGLVDYWSPWTESYTESGVEDYCRYTRALVSRYKDRIKHWEIWNEPNIFFWSGPKELYPKLLDRAYETIKEVDPEAVVFGCSTAGIDLSFVRDVMDAGARFDGLTIHPYRGMLDDAQLVKELRDASELVGGRPVWITEMGWPTQVGGVSEREQAHLLARCYLDSVASGAVGNVSWYDFREDGSNPYYNEHHFGIIRRDFSPKPAYRAAATVCRTLEGCRPVGFEDWGEGVVACRFSDGGKEKLAVWANTGGGVLRFRGAGNIAAVNLMGEPVKAAGPVVCLTGGAPVIVTTPRPGMKAEVTPLRLELQEEGLRPGDLVELRLETGGLTVEELALSWQLPDGWTVAEQDGKHVMTVAGDAGLGVYEVVAVVRVRGGEVIVPARVEVVPEVIEV